ncbi:ankyrin repeat and SOCS box protein 3-like [Littorina saxatilis]|uniref:ankyrin repeat and SOCS box protein 3-like n=1 Tax=Littorina saxatilis TaxID=31220 RepID=UPI0038B46A1A
MGCSCLHLAAVLGLSQLCRLLLDKGADPCVKDRFSNSVLILAAASGDVETVKMIVAAGGSVTDVNDEEVSAVHVACKQGSVEVVEFLLQQPEVDLNKASSFMDEIPLFCAAYFGHLQVVELLVQKGADVNKTTVCNLTPVHMAARNSHTNVIDFLAKNGANLNVLAWVVRGKRKKTKLRFVFEKTDICKSSPLYFAVDSTQDGSSVKVLLDHGADVEAVTCLKPYTPMMLAAAKCKIDIARMLLKAGAKVDRPDLEGKGAVSPLLYAIQSYHPGGWKAMEAKILELVKLLVEEGGASLEAMDVEINQNCVLLSVMCEMHEVFEYLLEKGADPWVFDSENQSTVKHCLDGHCGCPRHWVLKCLQAGLFNWNNMTSFLWGVKPLDYAVFHSDIHGIKMFEAAGFLSQLCLSDAGMSGDFREGMQYFEAAVKKVPSLQNICRFVVSDAVGERPGRRAGIAALPVAEKLKCFLMYEDLLPLLKPSPPLYVEFFGKMMPIVRSKHFHSMTDRELIQERGSQSEIEQLGPEPECECECEGMGWHEFPHDPETFEDEMVSGPPDECNMC